MIDAGLYASPVFVDIDNDGDLDALVGESLGKTLYFRNTGTANNPVFAARATPSGLSDVGYDARPTFADIDGDGDLDAFIGNSDGNTLFFRNTGTASNPVFAAPQTNPFGLSDVGSYADPTFVDIDGDGDLDAFVGESFGNTLFFRNTGTVNNPVFAAAVQNPFGLVDVGYSASPDFVDIDGDGNLDAFIGHKDFTGDTWFFLNASSGLLLFSTSGNDILTGTSSLNDTVSYVSVSAAVTVSLAITTQQNTVGAGLDTLTDIENLIGSSLNDSLIGNNKHNILDGGAGNDKLNGGVGADNMIGGLGNDTFIVNNASDVVTENLNEGTDKINSSITYTLPNNVENLTLTGALAINGIGNGQANSIIGNVANNQLFGGAGNDILNGGAGTNILTGGTGNDTFRFSTNTHSDTIIDYNVANDIVQLENAVFTALITNGTLAAGQFRIDTQAMDANDFIIYNSVIGKLLYDADGNGVGTAVQIAVVGTGLAMTNAEFVVI